jgi:hypothetical protein
MLLCKAELQGYGKVIPRRLNSFTMVMSKLMLKPMHLLMLNLTLVLVLQIRCC